MSSDTRKSFKNLACNFERALLDFMWIHWSALGVFGTSTRTPKSCVDPEVLVLLTTEMGRHDARLFDEVLDWLMTNSRWLNTQRLRSLHTKHHLGDTRVLAAIASQLLKTGPVTKWENLASLPIPDGHEVLFRQGNRDLSATPEIPDSEFLKYGLVRPQAQLRDLAQPLPAFEPSALMFRMRALFGVGMRPDILSHLILAGDSYATRIADILGYSQKRVQDTLLEMYGSGFVKIRSTGHKRIYGVEREVWERFLHVGDFELPRWRPWCPLARALTSIWRGIWAQNSASDPYVISSRLRSVIDSAQEDLQESGFGSVFADARSYDSNGFMEAFDQGLGSLLDSLLTEA